MVGGGCIVETGPLASAGKPGDCDLSSFIDREGRSSDRTGIHFPPILVDRRLCKCLSSVCRDREDNITNHRTRRWHGPVGKKHSSRAIDLQLGPAALADVAQDFAIRRKGPPTVARRAHPDLRSPVRGFLVPLIDPGDMNSAFAIHGDRLEGVPRRLQLCVRIDVCGRRESFAAVKGPGKSNVSFPAPTLIGSADVDLSRWANGKLGRILISDRGITQLVIYSDGCGKGLAIG